MSFYVTLVLLRPLHKESGAGIMYRILIVEDDDKIAAQLANTLERYGFEPQRALRMKELQREFTEWEPHLLLLDINLPFYDGFYWCRQFRKLSMAPVIFLSARTGEMDQVIAIENGGDDYVTKPIHLDLLLAKIKSALRRAYGEYASSVSESTGRISIGQLVLDVSRSLLLWQNQWVVLSRNERLLAEALLGAGAVIVPRNQLLETLWDDTTFINDNTLTVNVTRLRCKLKELGLKGVLETHRGQGYCLNKVMLQGVSGNAEVDSQ